MHDNGLQEPVHSIPSLNDALQAIILAMSVQDAAQDRHISLYAMVLDPVKVLIPAQVKPMIDCQGVAGHHDTTLAWSCMNDQARNTRVWLLYSLLPWLRLLPVQLEGVWPISMGRLF